MWSGGLGIGERKRKESAWGVFEGRWDILRCRELGLWTGRGGTNRRSRRGWRKRWVVYHADRMTGGRLLGQGVG
eukprot:193159-Amorphochlora_amoeboformis.AAC.1